MDMWTTTTRLHLLNAISRYGLRKTSFIGAYLKVYAKVSSNNWKKEYSKMIKEYIKNKETTESVKEYFQKRRKEMIDMIIEKKKQEKSRIIERMIYGYDSLEHSESEEDPVPVLSPEIAALSDSTSTSLWGVKSLSNPLSTTLLHLSTLSSLPPHLELPGPKPEVGSGADDESSFDGQCTPAISQKEQELEDILTSLEVSNYGLSVSSVDPVAFERFFRWTLEQTSALEAQRLGEESAMEMEEIENMEEGEDSGESLTSGMGFSLKEYFKLDFHEYPKKRSPRDKSKWVAEFSLVLARLKVINGGKVACVSHDTEESRGRKKVPCIKCFDADVLEEELRRDYRPTIAEYVFRGMLFLQTAIFQSSKSAAKEIDMIKGELYKFYEYYRK
ncbi:hypothetical protein NEHOM01_0382 [Nematocida homosporus]|uniref:uncharacterized protein n=1 Tax=Nematocida homosporus TaxID=1912981 RepID=UPI00221F3A70|nr:uncharacterized protein NEHOM01_0382 [Nematocida homosporus]KAI5184780.1 hypothetical protein NEHOM01_0382 [Nematocida homosporus]